MLGTGTAIRKESGGAAHGDVVGAARAIGVRDLAPIVRKIDVEGLYPEDVMRALGRAGAFATHLPGRDPNAPDLTTAIRAMSVVAEHCLSTAFCMWCQDALGWYIFSSANEDLKQGVGQRVASGEALGGTALSNPMKSFFGIEPMRLKGRRFDGGYIVRGLLPFVSNLGADHYFGAVFEVEDEPRRFVMAIVPCGANGVGLSSNTKFVALDGTRTFALRLDDVMVQDTWVLADPSDAYIKRIRAGFVFGVTNTQHQEQYDSTIEQVSASGAVTKTTSYHQNDNFNWLGATVGGEVVVALTDRVSVVPDVRVIAFPFAEYARTTIVNPGVSVRWRF